MIVYISMWIYQSFWVARTNYHRLDAATKFFFFFFAQFWRLEGWIQDSNTLMFSVINLFLVYREPSFSCVFVRQKKSQLLIVFSSLIRTSLPNTRILPLLLNYIPKAPSPNTTKLGLGCQHKNLGIRGHIYSNHCRKYSSFNTKS